MAVATARPSPRVVQAEPQISFVGGALVHPELHQLRTHEGRRSDLWANQSPGLTEHSVYATITKARVRPRWRVTDLRVTDLRVTDLRVTDRRVGRTPIAAHGG